ncbi:hypothetical protein ACFW1P_31620 [Paenibacillus sp. NPDC058910]|uniref:hypothetical protein n=1 Tax=unclassified Paenibacillus TaxID=185978 RepID=UPI0036781818
MDQRRGRIDSGKTIVGAFGAEFLPLSSSFRKFGDNSDWRNDTTAQRHRTMGFQAFTTQPTSLLTL